ncbi:MAG: CoA transferase, partial [Pseudonocardia sp.]|nr:CoA transferase [Pseudonocardia sp.]
SEVLAHPQLAARKRWVEVDSEVGPLRALLPPIGFAGRAPRMDRIPTVGEHNEEILRWLDGGPEHGGG